MSEDYPDAQDPRGAQRGARERTRASLGAGPTCAEPGRDPDTWFPASEKDPHAVGAAVVLCNRCPVRAACLRLAVATKPTAGIWGGLTSRQLTEWRYRQDAGDTEWVPLHHGTGRALARGCDCPACATARFELVA